LKSDILGIPAEDYGTLDLTLEELYSGQRVFEISGERLKEYESNRFLPLDEDEQLGVFANEYFILQEFHNPRRRLLGRYHQSKKELFLSFHFVKVFGEFIPKILNSNLPLMRY